MKTYSNRICNLTVFLIAATLGSVPVRASALNVDFGQGQFSNPADFGPPSSAYGAASGQTGTWNQIVTLGTTNGLLDIVGANSGVSLNLTASTIGGESVNAGTTDTNNLRDTYFYSFNGTAWSAVFNGLTNGLYDVYYYTAANTVVPSGAFRINGTSVPSINGGDGGALNLPATLNNGTDWDVLKGVSVTNGRLTLQSASNSGFRGLAGVQIVPEVSSPEPSSIVVVAGAVLGFVAARISRRRISQQ
jgi:hypothetical protein